MSDSRQSGAPAASGAPSGNAMLLLMSSAFIWGGNAVASRMAVGQIAPFTLTFARWLLCFIALWLFARRDIRAHWRSLLPHWRHLLLMGMFGFTGFNALMYTAGAYTTAINLAIIQGSIPVIVLLGAVVMFGFRVRALHLIGIAMTFAGIALIASQGQLQRLSELQFNFGDVLMLVACVFYAGYTLGLRNRPSFPPIVYFSAICLVAAVTSAPLFAYEIAIGRFVNPTAIGYGVLVFVGLFPSFVAQLTYLRGVGLIGPARAGLYLNLVPVFGSLLAVVILREPFALYHAQALVLVLGGVLIADRLANRRSG